MRYLGTLLSAALLSLGSTATAATVTAKFNTDDGDYADFATQTYRENGLNFAVFLGHYEILGMERAPAFHVDDSDDIPAVIEITFDGGLFDLVSFDVTFASSRGVAVFTSNLGDSFIASNDLGVNLFPSMFKGVSAITFFFENGGFEFDDFTVDDRTGPDGGIPSPVPLPATLPLLVVAIGGLGLRRRKCACT